MPLAVLVLGSVAAALPAAAAERAAPGQAAAEAPPRDKADRPVVMLVCRETRGERRVGHARLPNLACVTRWTGA